MSCINKNIWHQLGSSEQYQRNDDVYLHWGIHSLVAHVKFLQHRLKNNISAEDVRQSIDVFEQTEHDYKIVCLVLNPRLRR